MPFYRILLSKNNATARWSYVGSFCSFDKLKRKNNFSRPTKYFYEEAIVTVWARGYQHTHLVLTLYTMRDDNSYQISLFKI